MSLGSYLSDQGYDGTFPEVSRGGKADYFGLHGDKRYAGFLQDQLRSGYLSPSSVNPYISQLIESQTGAYQSQQNQFNSQMAMSGMNPAMAAMHMGSQEAQYKRGIGAQTAGFEMDRQGREFEAGESFIGFQSALESETTARAENARRYRKQMRDQKKSRRWNQGMQVIGGAMQAGGMMMGVPPGVTSAMTGGNQNFDQNFLNNNAPNMLNMQNTGMYAAGNMPGIGGYGNSGFSPLQGYENAMFQPWQGGPGYGNQTPWGNSGTIY